MKRRLSFIAAVSLLLSGCGRNADLDYGTVPLSTEPMIRIEAELPAEPVQMPGASNPVDMTMMIAAEIEQMYENGITDDSKHPTVPESTLPSEPGPNASYNPTEETDNRQPTAEAAHPETENTEAPAETPKETRPAQTEPMHTEPPQTEPPETRPPQTEPPETQPPQTEPTETEPPAERIDTDALEAYARSYAFNTYGYEGDASLSFSNAGYFPGVRVFIRTMSEGYAAAQRAVDDQYRSDMSMGYPIVTEIDGVICRAKLNVRFEPADQPNTFTLWCFYG